MLARAAAATPSEAINRAAPPVKPDQPAYGSPLAFRRKGFSPSIRKTKRIVEIVQAPSYFGPTVTICTQFRDRLITAVTVRGRGSKNSHPIVQMELN